MVITTWATPSIRVDATSSVVVPRGTELLTPEGWRAPASLRGGEQVVEAGGEVAVVIDVLPAQLEELWRVELRDGSSSLVTADQTWGREGRRTDMSTSASDNGGDGVAAGARQSTGCVAADRARDVRTRR